ncbi:MAG: hypothetical protein IT426_10345 [Pirellulales bacterium]|nr:hypothetical protein [Pirellulales bacterium]
MFQNKTHEKRILEIILILICIALCCLLFRVGIYRMVVLNLFYLPVVLAAFFLGRYHAGILALFCVMCVSTVIALNLNTAAAFTSPLVIGLSLAIWGAVMGINAILVGTLSDENTHKIEELHDAYVGVVEVLGRYLNSADPKLKDQAARISELSRRVAARMKLSDKEIDDIRVAALLQDMESIEVTARVIRKAMGDLSNCKRKNEVEHTFNGRDLVHSLGSVLTGALPLLIDQRDGIAAEDADEGAAAPVEPVLGAKILRTVRRYSALLSQSPPGVQPRNVLNVLKNDLECEHHPAVLHALEQVVLRTAKAASEPELLEVAAAEN